MRITRCQRNRRLPACRLHQQEFAAGLHRPPPLRLSSLASSALMPMPARSAIAPGSRINASSALPSTVAPEYSPISFSTGLKRLHHDFFRIGQPIHHQPEVPPVGIQHRDELFAVPCPAAGAESGISSRSRKTSGSNWPRRRYRGASSIHSMAGLFRRNMHQFRERPLREAQSSDPGCARSAPG